ncbi:hypothetical protein N0V90_001740 [Kalmusia sp. IMI 367209]|nr:hypothetical protein N0V90_001740 [Kalmusia sp. IMI 367209]
MATHDFEQIIEKACTDREIPGAVLLATNRDGSFTYSKAFGKASLREDGEQPPMRPETVSKDPASCTKLITSLATLHLVSTHNFTLDDPTLVYTHIPELKSYSIIQPDGTTKPHESPITLRQLLTHTSGLTYDMMSRHLIAWGQQNNKAPQRGGTVLGRHDHPLTFEPGASWMYGGNLDFAGLFVERVSGVSLSSYVQQHICEPLGIKDMAFHLSKRADLKARLSDISYRDLDSGKVEYKDERVSYQTPDREEVEGCLGGEGLLATPGEYIKVLRAVLNADERILPASFVDEFFSPQLTDAQADALNALLQLDLPNDAMCGTNKSVRKNWGLGGMLLQADDHAGGRKEGTMVWGGLPMLAWFVDRKTGLCGLFSTQVLPTGDKKSAELARTFENGVYALYEESGKKDSSL